jgi:Sap, sulfolipid-1-addressing protein
MWGPLLGLGVFITLNPVRIGIILLVVSRPRPVPNLLVYWLGCLTASVVYLLIPLTVLHVTPAFTSFTKDLTTPDKFVYSIARHIEIGIGVVALLVAALMAVCFSVRRRAPLPAPGGNTSTLVLDSNPPTAISRLLGRAPDAATVGGSAIRRLLGRIHNAWESGSLWVALLIGVAMAPSLEVLLLIIAIILASGAAIGTQVSAAIAFVVLTLAVEEVILTSYRVTPGKTQVLVQRLHDWGLAHQRKILVAVIAAMGVSLAAHGMGSI